MRQHVLRMANLINNQLFLEILIENKSFTNKCCVVFCLHVCICRLLFIFVEDFAIVYFLQICRKFKAAFENSKNREKNEINSKELAKVQEPSIRKPEQFMNRVVLQLENPFTLHFKCFVRKQNG